MHTNVHVHAGILNYIVLLFIVTTIYVQICFLPHRKLESQVHTGQFSFNNERKLLLEIESLKKAKLKVK